ncbi:MAG: phosphatase PAP2 family protein [Spirochaetes bacterium]|nr:phosphatase PAP2 family protein [Spirochaetota bacterium]
MNPILTWGLDVVRSLQGSLGHFFLIPMKAITLLGSEFFVLAALPLIYWCVDRKKGARLAILILLSAFLNLWVKSLFMQPRPYDIDPSVGLDKDPTSAFPSGHSQTSVTFWGGMLDILPRTIGIVAAIAVPFLVGFSRVYLGAHFPTDVLAGWVFGVLIVGLYKVLDLRVETLLGGRKTSIKMIVVAAAVLGMNALMPHDTALAGAFFGGATGFVFASKTARFSAKGKLSIKALRYLLGIACTLVLYIVPKLLLGDAFPTEAAMIRFLRYGLVGAWVAYGAPRLFLALKLAEPESGEEK